MIKVPGLHVTKVFTFKRRKLQTTKKLSLCHLSILLRGRRGHDKFLAKVDGGTRSSAVGGGAADAAEDAKGEIIVTNAGANFFAFLKKAFISSRVRPWGELTFFQSKSMPCAKESAMAPSAPHLMESPFSWRVGSSVVSKDLARLLKLSFGTDTLFFDHNPTNNHDRTRLTNSKVS
jgi:hypothetical protein